MKYCESILHELSFNLDKIVPCCCPFSYKAPSYVSNIHSIDVQFDNLNLRQKQQSLIKSLNEKTEDYSCKNCIFLKDDNNFDISDFTGGRGEKQSYKYNSIYIRHWTKCNANCIHCDNNRDKSYGQNPIYNPYNIIKEAYENNLIDTDNLVIRFQGGDIGVLSNFEELMKLFEEKGYKTIHFSTNNIIYQPAIEKVLLQGKGSLNVSIDSGKRETYKKIKQVDKFDNCINNLRKYLEKGISPEAISIHYIIIQDYNDNKEEIEKFLNLMNNIGIKCVGVRIDHKDLNEYLLNKAPISFINKYKELITYFYKMADKYSLKLDNDKCIEQNFILSKNKNTKKQNIFTKLFKIFTN